MSWFTESNRWKHFLYSIPCGMLFTILFAAGINIGMEFKDKYTGHWDWIDLLSGMLGGLIGQGIQLLIILLCL